MKPANDFWHPLNARRAHDIADYADLIWSRFNRGDEPQQGREGEYKKTLPSNK
jgi:hypothetical protein